jgi:hypothetical protein
MERNGTALPLPFRAQTLTPQRTWYPSSRIAWGLSGAQRWLLWTLKTPSYVKRALSVHRNLCANSSSAGRWCSHSQNCIRRGRSSGNIRGPARSGMVATDRREALRDPSVGTVPRLSFHSCDCDVSLAGVRELCSHNCRGCYIYRPTDTLLLSSKSISVWMTTGIK